MAVRVRLVTAMACMTLGACAAVTPTPDTAQVPFGAFVGLDNDVPAANQAS